jgi:maltose O-acetyltransferase
MTTAQRSLLGSIVQRLRDKGVGPLARRALGIAASGVKARVAFRSVEVRGEGVHISGAAPRIHNPGGRIELGDRILFDAPVTAAYIVLQRGAELCIGDDAYINDAVWIGVTRSVRIGARVRLGPGVRILDNDYHDPNEHSVRPPGKPIVIEDDVWIGSDAIVLPGITIGRRAIVGAHAVVTADVEPGCVVVGNPARVVRRLELQREVA